MVLADKNMKTRNDNNHVQVLEKRNATSVIIIHIKSDSLKNQKKFYILRFLQLQVFTEKKIKTHNENNHVQILDPHPESVHSDEK